MSELGKNIPEHCRYWQYQGDHNMIGCKIDSTLCAGNLCNPEAQDPTGFLRNRIDERVAKGWYEQPRE